mmetsp:Transcript_26888/g.30769  ORF Transcript_26888/g.30769 Transcript_26888/m.30769 type:complete len:632 (+) Transcript_26888:153-2048(+)
MQMYDEQQSPLTTILTSSVSINDPEEESVSDDSNKIPLDSRVIEMVRNSPNLTIRPARLATELGISIDEASSELCGLLRAVGSTATFTFESISSCTTTSGELSEKSDQAAISDDNCTTNTTSTTLPLPVKSTTTIATMVFSFPNDFEQKANTSRRKENLNESWWNILYALVKILKVIVAFGLVLSLIIVVIGGICVLIGAVIALTRSGGGGHGRQHHRRLSGHIQSLSSFLRQLLWFYVIFGRNAGTGGNDMDDHNGIDPFLAETLFTFALWSPRSIWFWLRMGRIRNRQQRRTRRRWGTTGVGSVINQGSWNENQIQNDRAGNVDIITSIKERGILSIAVEFLFGPTPFWPKPTDFEKWKLRESIIMHKAESDHGKGITLLQLMPFVDYPPPLPPSLSQEDSCSMSIQKAMISECLSIISHFNGVPILINEESSKSKSSSTNHILTAKFTFPELLLESESNAFSHTNNDTNFDHHSWKSFLYDAADSRILGGNITRNAREGSKSNMPSKVHIPKYLHEKHHVLTRLTKTHFLSCLALNSMNYIGLILLWKSIHEGGVLEIQDKSSIVYFIVKWLLCILDFYAKLFILIPLIRMIIIVGLNKRIEIRNTRRHGFVFLHSQIAKKGSTHDYI